MNEKELELKRSQFGKNLKRLRERDRLSQAALAKLVGADQSTICNLESGRRWPGPELQVRLAEVLGISIGDLWEVN